MKIDAFSLDLFTSTTITQTRSVTQTLSFTEIMDSRLNSRSPGAGAATPASLALSSPWYAPMALEQGGQGAVLADQFRAELDKMRRVMDAVMAAFQGMTTGCTCRLSQVDQVYGCGQTGAMGNAMVFQEWEQTLIYEMSQTLLVKAGGTIQTADSHEIDFSLDLTIERQVIQEAYFTETRTGVWLKEPMTVFVDTPAPMLAGGRFGFSLESGGQGRSWPGWGRLSLDPAIGINWPQDLSGPAAGNGLSNLSFKDQAFWMDETQGIFDQLTLWDWAGTRTALTRVKDRDLGDVYQVEERGSA